MTVDVMPVKPPQPAPGTDPWAITPKPARTPRPISPVRAITTKLVNGTMGDLAWNAHPSIDRPDTLHQEMEIWQAVRAYRRFAADPDADWRDVDADLTGPDRSTDALNELWGRIEAAVHVLVYGRGPQPAAR